MLRKALLVLTLCCIAISSHAQMGLFRMYAAYQNSSKAGKRMFQRYYLGGGTASMTATIEHRYYDGLIDKSYKMKVPSSNSFSVTEGFYFQFSRTGKKEGGFGLDVSTTANIYNFNVGMLNYDEQVYSNETGFSYEALVPFALVYKSGGEVTLNKKHKFLFTAGLGVAPGYTITKIYEPYLNFAARKFIMMEMGYFAGLAFKVRATAYFGDRTLVDVTEGDFANSSGNVFTMGGFNDTKVTSKTSVNLALLIMPFSFGWKSAKDSWDDYSY